MTQLLLRLVFTVLLLFVAYLCFVEIYRIWDRRRLVLGTFSYIKNGQDSTEDSRQFPILVKHDLEWVQLIHRTTFAKVRRLARNNAASPPADQGRIATSDQLGREDLLRLPAIPQPILPDVEIQLYGVQVSTLLRQLGKLMEQPNEIGGTVTERPNDVFVHAEFRGSGTESAERWDGNIYGKPNRAEASFELACRIIRVLAAAQVHSVYSQIEDHDFFQYSQALGLLQSYNRKLKDVGAATDPDQAAKEASSDLDKARRIVEALRSKSSFPFLHELAAQVAIADAAALKDGDAAKKSQSRAITELESYVTALKANHLAEDTEARTTLDLLRLARQTPVSSVAAEAAISNRSRARPIRPGVSISSAKSSAGTLTCLVLGRSDHKLYLLTADHVVGEAKIDDVILQPGAADGGAAPNDGIARLTKIIRPSTERSNSVGAALAAVTISKDQVSPSIPGAGPSVPAIGIPALGMAVRIFGRTSGERSGTVTSFNDEVTILIGHQPFRFSGLFACQSKDGSSISAPGDSGAPVFDNANLLLGLVYAGDGTRTFVMPIQPIMDALDVELVAASGPQL